MAEGVASRPLEPHWQATGPSHILLRKFHKQDCVLRSQTDEHDQANLHVNIILQGEVFISSQVQRSEGAADRDRHAEQYAEGQRPALKGRSLASAALEGAKLRLRPCS